MEKQFDNQSAVFIISDELNDDDMAIIKAIIRHRIKDGNVGDIRINITKYPTDRRVRMFWNNLIEPS